MTLAQYLDEKSLMETAFAELIGVKQATINRYINKKRFPSPDVIRKVEAATKGKVRVSDWFLIDEAAA